MTQEATAATAAAPQFTLNVNGTDHGFDEDLDLLEVLRDKLRIKSAKDGCNQGSCGTCMVLVDGKAVRACTQRTKRLVGKKIVTIEGFSQREKDVFAYTFAKNSAVQCGFCIPGMVISAKALVDTKPQPTRDEVKFAIRTNICRCTGYQQIEDAILDYAQMMRDDAEIPVPDADGRVGSDFFRVDSVEKTLGYGEYVDDLEIEGLVHGRNVFSPCARARINGIDTSEAETMPGVIRVLTATDIPGSRYIGHLAKDWPGMIAVGEETKMKGDTLAIVVAETLAQAEAAAAAVKIDYEELEPVTTAEAGMAEGAPLIHGEGYKQFGKWIQPTNNVYDHEVVKRGDAEAGFARSTYFAEATWDLPAQEHAFMETEAAIGIPDGDGIMVITAGQGIYDEYHEVAEYLGLPQEKVRIRSAWVGGGFGGKEDMSVQHQAALCAFLVQRPVKVKFGRTDSINYHPKRHPMTIQIKVGCDADGVLQAMQARVLADCGAYGSLSGPVLQRTCTHLGGPYNYHDIDIVGDAIYTNNPPTGAFRGFGVTQSAAVIEPMLNDLARQAGIDPFEFRYRNAIRPGLALPNGQIVGHDVALVESLDAVKPFYDRYKADPDVAVGIACGLKNAGIGVGLKDPGRCNLAVVNGKVEVRTSAAANGQGIASVVVQMAVESTGLPLETFVYTMPDTSYAPDAGTTTASRQTVFTGQATRIAGQQLKAELDAGKTLADLEGQVFQGEFDAVTDPITSTKPNPVSHLAYAYGTQLVAIKRATGEIIEIVAAHDSGTIVNPGAAKGQVIGGIAMGIGYGLTENFTYTNGVPDQKLAQLGLVKSNNMPPVTTIFVNRGTDDDPAYGAKGIGEITCCMAAPAAQEAYFQKDGVFRTKYPLENTFYRQPKK